MLAAMGPLLSPAPVICNSVSALVSSTNTRLPAVSFCRGSPVQRNGTRVPPGSNAGNEQSPCTAGLVSAVSAGSVSCLKSASTTRRPAPPVTPGRLVAVVSNTRCFAFSATTGLRLDALPAVIGYRTLVWFPLS